MAHVQTDSFPYAEEEVRKQFKDATHRAAEADRRNSRAVTASYDTRTRRLVVEFTSGVVVQIPSRLLQGLVDASPQDLAAVTLSSQGTALHWEKLDADFSVAGLLAGVFGTQAWMAAVGRKGGQAKSAAKAAAARANGQKGGRPPVHRRPHSQGTQAHSRARKADRTGERQQVGGGKNAQAWKTTK
jgi:hypothetical protein